MVVFFAALCWQVDPGYISIAGGFSFHSRLIPHPSDPTDSQVKPTGQRAGDWIYMHLLYEWTLHHTQRSEH